MTHTRPCFVGIDAWLCSRELKDVRMYRRRRDVNAEFAGMYVRWGSEMRVMDGRGGREEK